MTIILDIILYLFSNTVYNFLHCERVHVLFSTAEMKLIIDFFIHILCNNDHQTCDNLLVDPLQTEPLVPYLNSNILHKQAHNFKTSNIICQP